jgi:hypothetical protein
MEPTTEFKINQELAQALLNYLQTRPYAEVHGLIAALLRLEPLGPLQAEKEG